MFSQLGYTLFFVICVILAIVGAGAFVNFLRHVSMEKQGYSQGKDWFRFVAPSALALFFAWWGNGLASGGIWSWFYLIVIAIGLPILLAYFLNKEGLETKNDRLVALASFLLLLNAAVFTALWTWHYRYHAQNDQGNQHLHNRNRFLIPLWIITILFGIAARVFWRRNNAKESDSLPF